MLTRFIFRFNPIAPTLLQKALQALLSHQFFNNSQHKKQRQPPKDLLDIILDSSNRDIRSAIVALQFVCIVELPRTSGSGSGKDSKKGKGKRSKTGDGGVGEDGKERKGGTARVVFGAVTRRELSLQLFHLMGKVLYNKRELFIYLSHLFS
jgi:cell cycle checkpoint protein